LIDTNTQIDQDVDAMRRSVGSRARDDGESHTVVLSKVYDTTLEDLWDACTSPERIPRWFLPVTGDLKVGGRYQLEGNAGGTVETCEAPNAFSATWEFGGNVSWIEVRLTAEATGGTRLQLEHITGVNDPMWPQFGPGAVGLGWDLALNSGLSRHLATGATVDPKAAAAWSASEEGIRFVTLAGQRWREAQVAAGADPQEAEALAASAIKAYTSFNAA
jgi:uncharacterized protein YndB with AHSA1/START domain